MEKESIITLLALIANFGDYVSTMIGIHKYGLREMNPIGRWLMKRPFMIEYVKLVIVSYWISTSTYGTKLFCLYLFGGVTILNTINILIKRRKLNGRI